MTPRAARVPEVSALLVTLVASACAGGLRPASPEVAARARDARTYSARLRVSLRGPEFRARTPVLLGFRRPDALRLEVPGPAGARLIAVTRAGTLLAVFPGERAVFSGPATEGELQALLGVGLTPAEMMDLLVGVGSPRLRSYRTGWKGAVPSRIEAVLPDGSRLNATVEEADLDPALAEAAFADPPHQGYRPVDAAEARRLWGGR
jgi:hypothetical protein